MSVHARIGSTFLVLNHFSQRYPKLPSLFDTTQTIKQQEKRGALSPTTTGDGDDMDVHTAAVNENNSENSLCKSVSFSFDLMRLAFSSIHKNEISNKMILFSLLLKEYESWESGTTKRLRGGAD
ncbi:hypothetical protein STCU_12336 [Strigomonas culicis]|uniref:Uncharacterized protein n=1 Tax=Strigomonas culicis TaxID=28005 RepID=S9UX81_9TRYP|nr:hypothetical protein STCU_12336 [Strigomonas culicis]|eukprot:EPY15115.1 hypothetical protein STCU_12336 [Strigomonas culicis]